jgi:hypothetical protein
MACHKEAESRHEAPAQKAKGKREEVPAGTLWGVRGMIGHHGMVEPDLFLGAQGEVVVS